MNHNKIHKKGDLKPNERSGLVIGGLSPKKWNVPP
jgi:hypothetical protein